MIKSVVLFVSHKYEDWYDFMFNSSWLLFDNYMFCCLSCRIMKDRQHYIMVSSRLNLPQQPWDFELQNILHFFVVWYLLFYHQLLINVTHWAILGGSLHFFVKPHRSLLLFLCAQTFLSILFSVCTLSFLSPFPSLIPHLYFPHLFSAQFLSFFLILCVCVCIFLRVC